MIKCMITILSLSILIWGSHTLASSPVVSVNEAAVKLLLTDDQSAISLTIENRSGHNLPAHIYVEILDPQSCVQASADEEAMLQTGTTIHQLALPLTKLSRKELSRILFYRLRYRIEPIGSTDVGPAMEGIISVSEITLDIFELKVTADNYALAGTHYPVRTRALHPITAHPVSGVTIKAEIIFDETNMPALQATGITDADGYVVINFDLPREIGKKEAAIKITGQRGILSQEVESYLSLYQLARILISTDKPLYQPGQKLHVRTLVLDSSQHVLANEPLSLILRDPEYAVVMRAELKTSRFGIASIDWQIPENIRLGDYNLEVLMDDE
ncbi:MAG: MG2 domain-containing protein, partial [Acidobacteriota bacterium]